MTNLILILGILIISLNLLEIHKLIATIVDQLNFDSMSIEQMIDEKIVENKLLDKVDKENK